MSQSSEVREGQRISRSGVFWGPLLNAGSLLFPASSHVRVGVTVGTLLSACKDITPFLKLHSQDSIDSPRPSPAAASTVGSRLAQEFSVVVVLMKEFVTSFGSLVKFVGLIF